MASFYSSLGKFLLRLGNALVANLLGIFSALLHARARLSAKHLMKDFVSVLGGAGVVLLMQVLSAVIFMALPAGRDIIMVVVEEMKERNGLSGNLVGLVLGTVFWSLFSEFGVRYAIYVTDNSGYALSEQRILWRKAVQQAIADLFLIIPYLVVLVSLYVNYRARGDDDREMYRSYFISLGVIIYLLMVVVTMIYFAGRNADRRQQSVIQTSTPPLPTWLDKVQYRLDAWCCRIYMRYFPPKDERKWCEMLKGIYNDHVFELRKWTQFRGEAEEAMRQLRALFMLSEADQYRFPQSPKYMHYQARVPNAFRLRSFHAAGEIGNDKPGQIDGSYRWSYFIPNRFYRRTHHWLAAIFSVAALWMLAIVLMPTGWYATIGSAGLVLGAFCSWMGLYLGVLFLDYGVMRRGAPWRPAMPGRPVAQYPVPRNLGERAAGWARRTLSVRTILLLWLLLASFTNLDHPVRYLLNGRGPDPRDTCCSTFTEPITMQRDTVKKHDTVFVVHRDLMLKGCDNRPSLVQHFRAWLARYAADSSHYFRDRATGRGDTLLPIVFVCAEGGALRTGAFTSTLLSVLQDRLPETQGTGFDFRRSIYACSGVSGGSLGLACFNALAYLDDDPQAAGKTFRERSKAFFNQDFLAPVLGKMLYGDLLQLWWPWHKQPFDRAIALEESWEGGYERRGKEGVSRNSIFSRGFLRLYDQDHLHPALFINTTEAETGLQCWLTNVRPDGLFEARERDLLSHKLRADVRLSTAVNFSTRFPAISPAAAVRQSATLRYHYVDGGYVENTGAATMLEILEAVRPVMDSFTESTRIRIYPNVLMLRFGEPAESVSCINFGNEWNEVLTGIMSTRAGRVQMADGAIHEYLRPTTTQDGKYRQRRALEGGIAQLHLTPDGKKVPMNWILSEQSLKNLNNFLDTVWKKRLEGDLKYLVFVDTGRFARVKR